MSKEENDNVLDAYLANNGTTRYQVAKTGHMSASNLARIVKSPAGLKNMTVRVIEAIAETIKKEPGTVLNELLALEASWLAPSFDYPAVVDIDGATVKLYLPDLDKHFEALNLNGVLKEAYDFVKSYVQSEKIWEAPSKVEDIVAQYPNSLIKTVTYSEEA